MDHKHWSNQKKKTPYELLEMLATHNHGTPFQHKGFYRLSVIERAEDC